MGRSNAVGGGYGHLIRAIVERELLVFVRYPINALGGVVTFLALFLVVFLGGREFGGQAFADSLEGIIIGYFLWMLATVALIDIGQEIGREAQWGTLERHFITPFGFGVVLLAKSVVKTVRVALLAGITLLVILLVTGERLRIDVLTVVPLVVLSLASVFGIGFALGGLSVLYKRIGDWIPLVQFAFVGLVAAPAAGIDWLHALPLVHGSDLLQRAMADGVRLWQFEARSLAALVATGVGYLVAGYAVFQSCQRRARRHGVLGDY
ncbi:hypothetical protein HTG_00475 [Natrinema mahii]|nr:hypothetical protein HTG_00475 [Natrinema mahii]